MFNAWIIDPDPIISMDLVEILQQRFADVAPRVFETSSEALDLPEPPPALAILRPTGEDTAFATLLDRLNAGNTPLILLEPPPPSLTGANIRSVPLPFSTDHIIAALTGLFGASQKPTLRPARR